MAQFDAGNCRAEITPSTRQPTGKVQITFHDNNGDMKATVTGFTLEDGPVQSGGMRVDFAGQTTIWLTLLGFEMLRDTANPKPIQSGDSLVVKFIGPDGDLLSQTWTVS